MEEKKQSVSTTEVRGDPLLRRSTITQNETKMLSLIGMHWSNKWI